MLQEDSYKIKWYYEVFCDVVTALQARITMQSHRFYIVQQLQQQPPNTGHHRVPESVDNDRTERGEALKKQRAHSHNSESENAVKTPAAWASEMQCSARHRKQTYIHIWWSADACASQQCRWRKKDSTTYPIPWNTPPQTHTHTHTFTHARSMWHIKRFSLFHSSVRRRRDGCLLLFVFAFQRCNGL